MFRNKAREIAERPARSMPGARARGFTLIELLVTLVILGLLAAVALPRFSRARDKAYQTQMQNDLHNLATAQEAYFDDFMTYTTDVNAMNLNLSEGVSMSLEADGTGWSAKASHTAIPAIQCGMYYGSATAPAGVPVANEGVIACN